MTDNRTTELLPCPFCGGEARLVNDYSSEKGMSYQIWHECTGHEGRSGGYGQGIKPFFETPWYATDAEAIAAWNTRGTRGTLTAEQVMAIAAKHQPDYCSDTHVCFDWQAIADELNAERHVETCKVESSFLNDFSSDHECWFEFDLSCGHHITGDVMEPPNYCEVCGAKIIQGVDNAD